MATYSNALQTQLNATVTKIDWASKLTTSMGATRTVVVKHDPQASPGATADDVWLSGTIIYSATLTGPLTVSNGNVTNFGRMVSETANQAADLTQGVAMLRVIGNDTDYWFQGTLGLTGTPRKYLLNANPDGVSGIGFGTSARIDAPPLLPVDVELTGGEPHHAVLMNWTDPNAPVASGTITWDTQVQDLVFEDSEIAAQMGKVLVFQSSQSIIHGDFEAGGILLVSAASNTVSGNAPLSEVMFMWKPHGTTWEGYPAMTNYDQNVHSTFMPPFKWHVYDINNNSLGAIEMHDGLPANSELLSQVWDENNALRPFVNCAQFQVQQSDLPARSDKAGKYLNGMTAESYRESTAKHGDTFQAVVPLYDANQPRNGFHHLYAAPKWGFKKDTAYGDSVEMLADDPQTDPYLFDVPTYHNDEGKTARMVGWGHEPGAIGLHDRFPGPGGPRQDRTIVNSILALWASDQNYVRAQGNVPIREMLDSFGLNSFNQSVHWVKNVKTGETIPNAQLLNGEHVFARAYYGGGPYFNGTDKTINLVGVPSGGSRNSTHNDFNGLMPWNGDATDGLHGYRQRGLLALVLRSPLYAVGAKFDFNAYWMGALGDAGPLADPEHYFLMRIHAWRYLHYLTMWKLASNHPLMYTRAEIENTWQIELENVYDKIYVPAFVNNDTSAYMTGVRNLGNPTHKISGTSYLGVKGGPLAYYMAHALVLMKQTGSWSAMRAKSAKCAATLDMIISCLDKYCFDWMLETHGRDDKSYGHLSTVRAGGYTFVGADVPADWEAANALMDAEYPTLLRSETTSSTSWRAMADWVTDTDGITLYNSYEQNVGMHLRSQYAMMRPIYFPEYANPKMAPAIAEYQMYMDRVTAQVNAAGTPTEKRVADWHYRYPSLGILKAPTELGE